MADFLKFIGSKARKALGSDAQRYQRLLAERGHFGTRKFHRHAMSFEGLGYLQFGDYKLPLINASYGGVRIAADSKLFLNVFHAGGRFRARLSILGQNHHLTFSVAYIQDHQIGLKIEPANREDTQFMKSILWYLDAGLILQSLSKQEISHSFKGPQWHSYGLPDHDVLVHLHIEIKGGALLEAHVSIRNGFRREIVAFNRSGITVLVQPKRKLQIAEKKLILAKAIMVILGLRQVGDTDRFDRLIISGMTRLFK